MISLTLYVQLLQHAMSVPRHIGDTSLSAKQRLHLGLGRTSVSPDLLSCSCTYSPLWPATANYIIQEVSMQQMFYY